MYTDDCWMNQREVPASSAASRYFQKPQSFGLPLQSRRKIIPSSPSTSLPRTSELESLTFCFFSSSENIDDHIYWCMSSSETSALVWGDTTLRKVFMGVRRMEVKNDPSISHRRRIVFLYRVFTRIFPNSPFLTGCLCLPRVTSS